MKPRPWHWLALLPTLGMLGGVPFVNRAAPRVLGLPPMLAWIIAWMLITAIVMAVIFALDHRNRP